MNLTRVIIWTGFVVLLGIIAYYGYSFNYYDARGINDLLTTCDSEAAQQILEQWRGTLTSKGSLIPFARIITYFEFLLIPLYVSLVIMYSDNRLQKEPALWLNTLLRLNMLMIVITGLLGITENIVMLYNLEYGQDDYVNIWWITWLKFILAGWTLLIWGVSKIKSQFL